MSDLIEQVHDREWFYAYELPDGSRAPTYHGGELDAIHETRWRMLSDCLSGHFPDGMQGLEALDLASHQGWFAIRTAGLGFDRVHGVDARESHVEDARLMASVYGLGNVTFGQRDIFSLGPEADGRYDVVLMLGLLYHLENPVGALRVARSLTRRLFVVETQVAPGLGGMLDYGSFRFVKPMKGSFALVDETHETHGPEASVTGICMVPSLEGLTWVLDRVGFSRVRVLEPPADAYEQLRYGKRVMVVAEV